VEVKENFELIRQHGCALDHEELERGLSGEAAAVLFEENHLVVAVGIAGPAGRFLAKDLARKIALAGDFAERISTALGRGASEFAA
jgi:DNA-binding IclR family transcriptional regulator